MTVPPPSPPVPSQRRAAWLNSLLVDHALLRISWRNWGVVEGGRLYRSNHPLPWQLRQAARRFGLRTVINLRGERAECGSDRLGRWEAAALGLAHFDAPFESRGAPHRERVLRLAEIYRTMAEPALIHCKSGADRTGLAAGIWLLLQGRPVEAAMAQLSLRFGHVRQSRTGVLDAFFALYAAHLRERGPKPFLDWVREDYDEEALRRAHASRAWADRLVDGVLRRE
ncbi:protein-tyrosine-phosphatase [Caldovatus sediminis]|jgi:protein tyrosine/serine phosphatase|uniref:Protein-tyrosine-phosphatase n=1 Tax=Caldovatus sediminis TaxID=2041189 RepID=A0A8J2Z779_9PROT|nr:tyrosine-protein phosphatase [Caldovatus sediminis]GGG16029.1 protein-tyrosine-phosphatase [Caldovatus sediminis]